MNNREELTRQLDNTVSLITAYSDELSTLRLERPTPTRTTRLAELGDLLAVEQLQLRALQSQMEIHRTRALFAVPLPTTPPATAEGASPLLPLVPRHSVKIPNNLPTFRTDVPSDVKSIDDFVEAVENKLSAANISEEHWSRILIAQVGVDMGSNLKTHFTTCFNNWVTCKGKFLKLYKSPAILRLQREQFSDIKMLEKEAVATFCDRFRRSMRLANRVEDSNLRCIFYARLPNWIKDRIDYKNIDPSSDESSLEELSSVAIEIAEIAAQRRKDPPKPTGTRNDVTCSYCASIGFPGRRHDVSACRIKRDDNVSPTVSNINNDQQPVTRCSLCGTRYHATKDCKTSAEKRQLFQERMQAYNNQRNSPTVSAIIVTDTPTTLSPTPTTTDSSVSSIVQPNSSLESFLPVPLAVNESPLTFYLDTMASHSFIDAALAVSLGLPISGISSTGLASSTAATVTSTRQDNVRLTVGTTSRTCSIFSMPLQPGVAGLIGMDLMSVFGITVSNLPTTFPATTVATDDQTTKLYENVEPTLIPDDSQEVLSARSLLEPLININKAIPTTSSCTHPFASIKLVAKTRQPLFIRQYAIPRQAQPTAKKIIDEWVTNEICHEAKNGCQWNFPLTMAPKRDEEGGMSNWRVCIDTRALNKLLERFDYPMKLIKDMVQIMSNFLYYT